jgi:rhamnosyl/mannosyltransferase
LTTLEAAPRGAAPAPGGARLLQLSKYFPPVDGGIEVIAFELTQGLRALGFATDVLCTDTGGRTVRERQAGGEVVRAGVLGIALSTPMSPALVLELLRARSRHDVIHLHAPNPMATLALWIARPRARIVVHWHSDVIRQQRAMRLFEPLQTWLLTQASAVIATSERYFDHSPWLQPFANKVRIVPLGIDVARHRAAPAEVARKVEALRVRYEGRPIVFSLGRMVPYKGFDDLIEAARRLRSDALVIVGGGGELHQAHRARVRELGLERRIRFVGRLCREDVEAHLSLACAYCLPSNTRAEAFGVAMLEAMALGVPVVATRIEGSGVPWVNQDGVTGYNVEVGNADAMAEALDALARDPARVRTLGDAARRRYLEHFTADRMVATTIGIYRESGLGR